MKLYKQKSQSIEPQKAKAAGIYPYFRAISSQDTEVMINGKKVLMFHSNWPAGLVNHPKIKEAAIEAIKKYGTGCLVFLSLTELGISTSKLEAQLQHTWVRKMQSFIQQVLR